jgi:hypothetical protein
VIVKATKPAGSTTTDSTMTTGAPVIDVSRRGLPLAKASGSGCGCGAGGCC